MARERYQKGTAAIDVNGTAATNDSIPDIHANPLFRVPVDIDRAPDSISVSSHDEPLNGAGDGMVLAVFVESSVTGVVMGVVVGKVRGTGGGGGEEALAAFSRTFLARCTWPWPVALSWVPSGAPATRAKQKKHAIATAVASFRFLREDCIGGRRYPQITTLTVAESRQLLDQQRYGQVAHRTPSLCSRSTALCNFKEQLLSPRSKSGRNRAFVACASCVNASLHCPSQTDQHKCLS